MDYTEKLIDTMDDSDVARVWAHILLKTADVYGAPIFALDMAAAGCDVDSVRLFAEEWKVGEFVPPEFADVLVRFADALDDLQGVEGEGE